MAAFSGVCWMVAFPVDGAEDCWMVAFSGVC